MKIYISGPMSDIPGWNDGQFNIAASCLRSYGLEVVSPAERGGRKPEDYPRAFWMREAVVKLLDCDAVFFLHGWWNSQGALLERSIAKELEMPIYDDVQEVMIAAAKNSETG
jgi:hypothetical protein